MSLVLLGCSRGLSVVFFLWIAWEVVWCWTSQRVIGSNENILDKSILNASCHIVTDRMCWAETQLLMKQPTCPLQQGQLVSVLDFTYLWLGWDEPTGKTVWLRNELCWSWCVSIYFGTWRWNSVLGSVGSMHWLHPPQSLVQRNGSHLIWPFVLHFIVSSC